MEEEILFLLNSTSLTDIILKYDVIEEKIHRLEKTVIDICNDNKVNGEKNKVNGVNGEKNKVNGVNGEKNKVNGEKNKDKLSELKKIIDKTTDTKIKESTIEDLIEKYKLISSLCCNN